MFVKEDKKTSEKKVGKDVKKKVVVDVLFKFVEKKMSK